MCTLALYLNVFADLPLLVAANRDEHFDRPSAPPAEIAGDPRIVAGRDLRVGGTWLGVNDHGLLVGILNRRQNDNGNNEPTPTTWPVHAAFCAWTCCKGQASPRACEFIDSHHAAYNPFTIVFADRQTAWVAYNNHDSKIVSKRLDPGLHVFSSAAELDLNSAKADRAHPRFAQLKDRLPTGRAEPSDWLSDLRAVLADHTLRDGSNDPGDAICVHRESTGTVSSSVVAMVAARSRFDTFFCPGPPCQNGFTGPTEFSDPMSEPGKPKHAATVILLRPAGPRGFEVFLTRRPDAMPFLGGMYCYPGGTVSKEDCRAATIARTLGRTPKQARQIIGAAFTPEQAIGLWIAAGARSL